MNNIRKNFDVVIVGGGLIGTTLACLLGQENISVALIERETEDSLKNVKSDGRVIATSHFSYLALKQIGAWELLEEFAEPILEIRVADNSSPLFVHFDFEEVGDNPLGYMIEISRLKAALYNTACGFTSVTLFSGSGVKEINNGPNAASATLENGEVITASLIVAADGRVSKIREFAGIKNTRLGYGQTAIVFSIEHEKPHYGVAVENFFPAGPFAVLPMKANRSAIVWSEKESIAPDYLKLSDEEFQVEVAKRVGGYLGALKVLPGRWSYPLSLSFADKYFAGRVVLVGDSAHAMHPIAGQGANVGFRDAAALAELIVKDKKLGLDIGRTELLKRYQQWRRFDGFSMSAITDILTRLFSNDVLPLKFARRSGLGVVNRIPPARRFFMRHAMGMLGKLPEKIKHQDDEAA